MIERLKELRRLLSLNQGEFANKIGMKQGSLSDIERGKVGLSNTVMKLICKTFNVSENWLLTGTGEPFNNEYEHRNDLSELEKEILTKFNKLDNGDRKAIESIIDRLYEKTIKDIIPKTKTFSNDPEISSEKEKEIQKEGEAYMNELRLEANMKTQEALKKPIDLNIG